MIITIKSKITNEVLFIGHTTNLAGTNLTNTDLRNTDLRNVDLRRADLTTADLTGADLTGANLTYADLVGANLTNANLTGANLTNANLTCANLTGADFGGACLANVTVTGAVFTDVKGLAPEHLKAQPATKQGPIEPECAVHFQGYVIDLFLTDDGVLGLTVEREGNPNNCVDIFVDRNMKVTEV